MPFPPCNNFIPLNFRNTKGLFRYILLLLRKVIFFHHFKSRAVGILRMYQRLQGELKIFKKFNNITLFIELWSVWVKNMYAHIFSFWIKAIWHSIDNRGEFHYWARFFRIYIIFNGIQNVVCYFRYPVYIQEFEISLKGSWNISRHRHQYTHHHHQQKNAAAIMKDIYDIRSIAAFQIACGAEALELSFLFLMNRVLLEPR